MKSRIYQGIELCKREFEWITWYQRGENSWWSAFFEYKHRKKRIGDMRASKTWFNKTLKGLHRKQLFLNVPFAFDSQNGLHWVHPGFANDGYRVEVGIDENPELPTYQKPII